MSRALGIIETRGLAAAIEAADSMVKAAAVELQGRDRVGGGLVAVIVRGDVGAVRAAVEAGAASAASVGQVVAQHVIPSPDEEIESLLPLPGSRGSPGRRRRHER